MGLRLKKNTRLKGATSPAGTASRATSDAPGGCAFQARPMCGVCPKRALRAAHGVMFVSPRRGVPVTNPQSPKRNLSFTFLNFAVFLRVLCVEEKISLLLREIFSRAFPQSRTYSARRIVCGPVGLAPYANQFRPFGARGKRPERSLPQKNFFLLSLTSRSSFVARRSRVLFLFAEMKSG